MSRVYVSIGSNIDPMANVRSAVAALRAHYGELVVSPVYETGAVGFSGADFLNLVVGFDTGEPPETVAAVLRELEAGHGRRRGSGGKLASRTLDLDLLTHGDVVAERDGLHLPRGEILEYAFVLRPLSDIAGDAVHPVVGRSYRALWAAFDASGQPMRRAVLRLGGP